MTTLEHLEAKSKEWAKEHRFAERITEAMAAMGFVPVTGTQGDCECAACQRERDAAPSPPRPIVPQLGNNRHVQ